MKILECEQYSPEWWIARKGIPTASQFGKIITPTGKLSTSADDYAAELIAEQYCELVEKPASWAMQNGSATEPEARRWFEMESVLDVRQVGFITTDDGRLGCSPDGLIGDKCGLELKCPIPKTQVRYLLDGCLPAEYRPQVHGSMIVTDLASWEFCSYCPGLPPFRVTAKWDDFTDKLAKALNGFLNRLDLMRDMLSKGTTWTPNPML